MPYSKTISEKKTAFTPDLNSDLDDHQISNNFRRSGEKDTLCGVGGCTPEWLQKFNSPKVFLLNYSILGVLQGVWFSYLVGCLSSIEKRFGYESKMSGLIMIADEFSCTALGVFMGYFGGKLHRPRIVAAGMMITAISCLLMSMPYFLYGPALHLTVKYTDNLRNSTKAEFCDLNDEADTCEKPATVTVVSLLFLGNFFKGLGSLAFYTIGTSYLDDSVKKKNSPVYFGTLFAFRLLGPALGFLLSSFCLRYYEDPFYDPGFQQNDPRWIGAWWMGFIIIGIAIFIFSVPMILFPRRFPRKELPSSLRNKPGTKEKGTPLQQIKDMGKAIKHLAKNPILVFHCLGGVLRLNGVFGFYMLLPKYTEMQFRQSASKASLYSGTFSIFGMQLGMLLGGIAIRKLKPRPRILTGSIACTEGFSFLTFVICMLITCPALHMIGANQTVGLTGDNLQNECNTDCMCTTRIYTPVCGPDGKLTYFSPCFAGCTGFNKTEEIFTECKCIFDDAGNFTKGDTENGYCDADCRWMVTYIVIFIIGKFISSTARVGYTIVILRCVDSEDKSTALGALDSVLSLLAFIPYPLIYGALSDSSCLIWEESCGERGNCWVYDIDKFRFLLHGVTASFVFLGCVTDIAVCILSPRLKSLYDENDEDENDNPNQDAVNTRLMGVTKTVTQKGSVHSLHDMDDKFSVHAL